MKVWISLCCWLICLSFLGSLRLDAATIRVAAYNTYNHPNDETDEAVFSTIFSAIGNESVNGIAKRLDILAVSETDPNSSTRLADILNTLYDVSTYNVVISSIDGGSDRTGIVYDSNALTLIDANDITDIGIHTIIRAHFRPAGYTSTASEFYVYSIHLTSGDSETQRALEAANLRSNADALGEGKHIIYAGDFNMYGSSEGAWTNMLASGKGQAFDTADSPGEWRGIEAFKWLHSQDPLTSGMDDRFDIQFVSGEFLDGNGLEYIPDSYHVFGNNGTHVLGDSISTGTGASPTVLAALEEASDHLPIVADYYIPNSICTSPIDADLNDDCIVDLLDFAILGSQWLQPPATPSADIAPEPLDDFVNILDLTVLVNEWLTCNLDPQSACFGYIPDSICTSPIDADLNDDCIVDLLDFAILESQWLQPPPTPSADIGPEPLDGFVNILDLAILMAEWLTCNLDPQSACFGDQRL